MGNMHDRYPAEICMDVHLHRLLARSPLPQGERGGEMGGGGWEGVKYFALIW